MSIGTFVDYAQWFVQFEYQLLSLIVYVELLIQ